MTDYRFLSPEDRLGILQEMDEQLADNPNKDVIEEQVFKGNNCADCYMIYYNCLCSHDED